MAHKHTHIAVASLSPLPRTNIYFLPSLLPRSEPQLLQLKVLMDHSVPFLSICISYFLLLHSATTDPLTITITAEQLEAAALDDDGGRVSAGNYFWGAVRKIGQHLSRRGAEQ